MNLKTSGKGGLSVAALVAAITAVPVQANTVSFDYSVVFSSGSVAPDGPTPYLTAIFDDGNTPGSVTLTMTAANVGDADIDDLYFNFDPSLGLNNLSFTYDAGSSDGPSASGGGNNGIFVGTDAFQADGDGLFDINFNFPPPPGTDAARWNANETVVYNITSSDDITADSFNFFSAPGGGAGGPFLSAAHFISTGPAGADGAWVGAVPVPAAFWLLGSGLLGLAGLARRRR